ncbi:hypothetical protein A3Q56_00719, partial [Intoshia linei]
MSQNSSKKCNCSNLYEENLLNNREACTFKPNQCKNFYDKDIIYNFNQCTSQSPIYCTDTLNEPNQTYTCRQLNEMFTQKREKIIKNHNKNYTHHDINCNTLKSNKEISFFTKKKIESKKKPFFKITTKNFLIFIVTIILIAFTFGILYATSTNMENQYPILTMKLNLNVNDINTQISKCVLLNKEKKIVTFKKEGIYFLYISTIIINSINDKYKENYYVKNERTISFKILKNNVSNFKEIFTQLDYESDYTINNIFNSNNKKNVLERNYYSRNSILNITNLKQSITFVILDNYSHKYEKFEDNTIIMKNFVAYSPNLGSSYFFLEYIKNIDKVGAVDITPDISFTNGRYISILNNKSSGLYLVHLSIDATKNADISACLIKGGSKEKYCISRKTMYESNYRIFMIHISLNEILSYDINNYVNIQHAACTAYRYSNINSIAFSVVGTGIKFGYIEFHKSNINS